MVIKESLTGTDRSTELATFAATLTEGIKPVEIAPYRKGVKTFVKGIISTRPDYTHRITVAAYEHEPRRRNLISRIGATLFAHNDMLATLIVEDLQEPSNNREVLVYPHTIAVLLGQRGGTRDQRHELTF